VVETAGVRGGGKGLGRHMIDTLLGSAAVRFAGMALSFLVGVQLARYLGPENYGVYGFAMSLILMSSIGLSLGVPPLATREAALAAGRNDWQAFNGVFRWSVGLLLALSCLLTIGGLILLPFLAGRLDPDIRTLTLIFLLIVPVYTLTSLIGALMRGMGLLVGGQALDAILRPAIYSALLFGAMLTAGHLDAAEALTLHLFAGLVTLGCGAGWLLWKRPADARTAGASTRARHWIRGALPMGLTDILLNMERNFPIVLLGILAAGPEVGGRLSAADVGIFRVAVSSALFVLLPLSLFAAIVVPIAAGLLTQGDRRRLQLFASAAVVAASGAILCISAFLWFAGAPLISLVFGADYVAAWPVLMVLCLTQIVASATGISPGLLTASGHEREVTRAAALSLAVGIAAAVVLTTTLGVIGMAWATVLAASTKSLMLYRSTVTCIGIDPTARSAKILLDVVLVRRSEAAGGRSAASTHVRP
jgi:O-antigen/teichoic acid export membrane protein